MKAAIQLITTALASYGLEEQFYSQLKYLNKDLTRFHNDQALSDRVRFFQEVWIAANEIEFCIFPAGLPQIPAFTKEYLETIGIDMRYRYVTSPERMQTAFKHINAPTEDKIPYLAHHVWLTHPDKPKEMLSQSTTNSKDGYEFHLNVTQRTLKQYNFTIYLWVNRIDLMPETKRWADACGVMMREISEFQGNQQYQPILNEIQLLIEQKQFAAGADIARLLILYAHGGVYADQDHTILEYDPILNKIDFFLYQWQNLGYPTVENSLIGSSPKNKFIFELLQQIVRNRQGELIPHFESVCLQKSYYYILYETGPHQFSRVFNKMLINRELEDQTYIILDSKIAYDGLDLQNHIFGDKYSNVVFKDKTHRLNVRFQHFLSGSWKDYDNEFKLFGWQNQNN
ncbi:UNKNOWN [Stylonychia lemnae]|uniref:Glycosyltransferase family 32 protein n=1 Tax=Stylonychia lemnae TaxID=5949 RepID=A0A078AGW1_STYLE|nr:UNKNOWN [Stylonychia lemnae]|eukprot:CDW81086.1 UNKNOWN [Stylonychia lemnae]